MTREEAIQILSTRDAHGVLCGYTSGVTEALDMAVEALRDKPRGEWLLECDGEDECDNLYKCSMCGAECGCEEYDKPNFCPNCGTDMRNEVDGRRIMGKTFEINRLEEMCDAMCDNVVSSDSISREDAIEAIKFLPPYREYWKGTRKVLYTKEDIIKALNALPSAEDEKKKAELKENGDWDCPDVYCDECDHHKSVEWCSLAIPNHEKEIDETYKMVNEAFFEGFDAAEKQYRFLIETVEELDKKIAEAEWIPCSERLPETGDSVLATYSDGEIGIIWDARPKLWGTYMKNSHLIYPIAWMPLPKPYRKDDEE